jgi:hypothetical protein
MFLVGGPTLYWGSESPSKKSSDAQIVALEDIKCQPEDTKIRLEEAQVDQRWIYYEVNLGRRCSTTHPCVGAL